MTDPECSDDAKTAFWAWSCWVLAALPAAGVAAMLSSLLSSPQTLETSKSKNIIKMYFKFMEQICSSVLGVEPGASHMTGKLSVTLSYTPSPIGVLRFILLQECFTCMYKCMLCLVPAGCWKRAGVNRQL